MNILINTALVIAGLFILIKSADLLVAGAVSIATRLRVSNLIIGLTIVSFGTSLPELVVNITASIDNTPDIAIGNILGSNVANILLILGCTAVVANVGLSKSTVFSELPFSLIAALLLGFLANANLFDTGEGLSLSRWDGIILIGFFVLFMFYVISMSRQETPEIPNEAGLTQKKAILFLVLGIAGLFVGGKMTVIGAVELATLAGFSATFIGLTVIAIGTSLPELITSVAAARKNNAEMAVGNVVGSNIFNILWILGFTSIIKPLPFTVVNNFDILIIIGSSSLIFIFIVIARKYLLTRMAGIIFILLYLAYLTALVVRG